MYGVVVAIDWFIDRFRTMLNVSSDCFAAGILTKLSGVQDPEGMVYETNAQAELDALQNAGQPGEKHEQSRV